eukprot:352749-Chlamydomonas_euryale.AAC.6
MRTPERRRCTPRTQQHHRTSSTLPPPSGTLSAAARFPMRHAMCGTLPHAACNMRHPAMCPIQQCAPSSNVPHLAMCPIQLTPKQPRALRCLPGCHTALPNAAHSWDVAPSNAACFVSDAACRRATPAQAASLRLSWARSSSQRSRRPSWRRSASTSTTSYGTRPRESVRPRPHGLSLRPRAWARPRPHGLPLRPRAWARPRAPTAFHSARAHGRARAPTAFHCACVHGRARTLRLLPTSARQKGSRGSPPNLGPRLT